MRKGGDLVQTRRRAWDGACAEGDRSVDPTRGGGINTQDAYEKLPAYVHAETHDGPVGKQGRKRVTFGSDTINTSLELSSHSVNRPLTF